MPSPLRTRLREYGCSLSAAEFRDLLADAKAARFPSWTDEYLSYTRDGADEYCQIVRNSADCQALPREFILGSLNNIRKHQVRV